MTERQIPFGRPWITDVDKARVLEVLDGSMLTHGPQGAAFEDEFADFLGPGAHCVTVSSCMAALHLAYHQLGIGPGDDVIVPAQTHVATVHAVELVGATPVFADCEPATGNVDPEHVARLVSPRTKAIGVVHFLGIPCKMREILDIAERHDLRVVEDCALALGARYDGVHVGLVGDAGCFSFYPVKHMTTGEGGMFVTRHARVAAEVARIRAFGVVRRAGAIPGLYDVEQLGLNYRMSELQAALGRSQLVRVPESLDMRASNFRALRSGLADAEVVDGPGSTHYCLSVRVGEARDAIVRRLNAEGIGTSVYYPHPVPRLAYYRAKYGFDPEATPNAVRQSDHSIALPVGPHVDEGDIDHMTRVFHQAIRA